MVLRPLGIVKDIVLFPGVREVYSFHWIFNRLLSSKGLRCQQLQALGTQAPLCVSVRSPGFTDATIEAQRGDWREAGLGSGGTIGD